MRLNRRYRRRGPLARPGDRGCARTRPRRRTTRGTRCWSSSTGSISPCCAPCATPAACAPPISAPCTSCSTREVAAELERHWIERGLGDRVPLELVECPDRRLRARGRRARARHRHQERAEVTVLLPRRTFRRLSQRLLHDRTADRIAEAVGRIPHVAATIVPFDTTLPHELEAALRGSSSGPRTSRRCELRGARPPATRRRERRPSGARPPRRVEPATAPRRSAPCSWSSRSPCRAGSRWCRSGTTAGKSLEAQVFDDTGGVRLLFFGRTRIAGIEPGRWCAPPAGSVIQGPPGAGQSALRAGQGVRGGLGPRRLPG